MFETKSVFMKKNIEMEAVDCVVDKTVQLSSAKFDFFSRNLTHDWDFIRDNQLDVSIDADGRRHCLLVTGKNRNDGILVSSEGTDYARYSAFLPNAAVLLDAARYPSLAGLSAKMVLAADDVVGQASAEWPEGVRVEDPCKYAVSFAYLNDKYDLAFDGGAGLEQAFSQMLCDRPEIRQASYNAEEFLIDAEPLEASLESGRHFTQDKPSVIKQLREARSNPAPPSPKKDHDKGAPGPER